MDDICSVFSAEEDCETGSLGLGQVPASFDPGWFPAPVFAPSGQTLQTTVVVSVPAGFFPSLWLVDEMDPGGGHGGGVAVDSLIPTMNICYPHMRRAHYSDPALFAMPLMVWDCDHQTRQPADITDTSFLDHALQTVMRNMHTLFCVSPDFLCERASLMQRLIALVEPDAKVRLIEQAMNTLPRDADYLNSKHVAYVWSQFVYEALQEVDHANVLATAAHDLVLKALGIEETWLNPGAPAAQKDASLDSFLRVMGGWHANFVMRPWVELLIKRWPERAATIFIIDMVMSRIDVLACDRIHVRYIVDMARLQNSSLPLQLADALFGSQSSQTHTHARAHMIMKNQYGNHVAILLGPHAEQTLANLIQEEFVSMSTHKYGHWVVKSIFDSHHSHKYDRLTMEKLVRTCVTHLVDMVGDIYGEHVISSVVKRALFLNMKKELAILQWRSSS
jgi:hypothetical protein